MIPMPCKSMPLARAKEKTKAKAKTKAKVTKVRKDLDQHQLQNQNPSPKFQTKPKLAQMAMILSSAQLVGCAIFLLHVGMLREAKPKAKARTRKEARIKEKLQR